MQKKEACHSKLRLLVVSSKLHAMFKCKSTPLHSDPPVNPQNSSEGFLENENFGDTTEQARGPVMLSVTYSI